MVNPKLTVIMPVYNMATTVGQALESVLTQQTLTCQIIAVDDNSDDDTWQILCEYQDEFPLEVQIIRRETGGGSVGALNTAIPYIQGDYVSKLDADDWFEPFALTALAAALDAHPEVGFVWGQCLYHNQKGDPGQLNVPEPFDAEELLRRNTILGEPMYRASAHRPPNNLRYRGQISVGTRERGCDDWDFALQLVYTLGWTGLALPGLLAHHYRYYLHPLGFTDLTTHHRQEMLAHLQGHWPQLKAGTL